MLKVESFDNAPIVDDYVFGDHPAIGIEGRQPKTDGELVVLISQLLELIEATCPKCAELDLGANPVYETVGFRIWRTSDVESLRRKPA